MFFSTKSVSKSDDAIQKYLGLKIVFSPQKLGFRILIKENSVMFKVKLSRTQNNQKLLNRT